MLRKDPQKFVLDPVPSGKRKTVVSVSLFTGPLKTVLRVAHVFKVDVILLSSVQYLYSPSLFYLCSFGGVSDQYSWVCKGKRLRYSICVLGPSSQLLFCE